MNNRLPAFFLLCFIALSCNKPLPDYSGQPFDYTISGIVDTVIHANDYMIFAAQVNVVSGDPVNNPITLTFKGVPPNVFLQKNNFSFRLNYQLDDSFGARNAAQGVYPMQAAFSSPAGTKTYDFNLTIAPPTDRMALLCGYYYPSNSCTNNIYVSCSIDSIPGSPGQVMLIDRTSPGQMSFGTYDTAYATVDCCTNTFVIPAQNVQGATISGNGSFNAQAYPYSVVTMNRTIKTDTANYNCTVTLSQD